MLQLFEKIEEAYVISKIMKGTPLSKFPKYQNNLRVATIAMQKNPDNFNYLDHKLKVQRIFVIWVLKYGNKTFKELVDELGNDITKDIEMVMEAIAQDADSLQFA